MKHTLQLLQSARHISRKERKNKGWKTNSSLKPVSDEATMRGTTQRLPWTCKKLYCSSVVCNHIGGVGEGVHQEEWSESLLHGASLTQTLMRTDSVSTSVSSRELADTMIYKWQALPVLNLRACVLLQLWHICFKGIWSSVDRYRRHTESSLILQSTKTQLHQTHNLQHNTKNKAAFKHTGQLCVLAEKRQQRFLLV